MKNKFDFYEVVKIVGENSSIKKVYGKEGIVIGMSQCEDTKEWGYAVDIFGEEEGWDFMESDLKSMNRFAKKEDIYKGGIVKVTVDPESGKGTLIDPED